MAKINGTLVLLYADGVAIALQKGLDVSAEQDLPDVTNKESGGWEEHMNGLRRASIDFDALFSTTGLSGGELIAYITSRTSLLMVITGGVTYPFVGEVDVKSVKLSAPQENPFALSGSLKLKGPLYQLKGTSAALVTDPDAGGTDYDTLTVSGIAITSAINAAGAAYCNSNTFSVSLGDVIKVAVFLTLNSGEVPSVAIWDNTSADISNVATLVAGLNILTLTVTGNDASASLRWRNSGAANWALSSIYAFKHVAS
jgi:predicted secreted protein